MIKCILFDLDGTLLPMDQISFVNAYFSGLGKKLQPFGFDAKQVVDAVYQGVKAMVKNDGISTNESVFWNKFSEILGEDIVNYKDVLEDYYKNEFQQVKKVCGFDKRAREVVELAKSKGYDVVLATSPMFPRIATESRLRWAGFEPNDFKMVTTYEDFSFTKPNLQYYNAVLEKIGVQPEECVMIGNDAQEDMIANEIGIKVFLLTECLVNHKNLDISKYEQGGFDELIEYIKNL